MTTVAEMLAFIQAQGRITSADENALLFSQTNESFGRYVRRALYPSLRTVATITTISGTQDYDLPSDFDRIYAESILYNYGASNYPTGWALSLVKGPDAELWEGFGEVAVPQAARIVAGTGQLKALRLMPAFTDSPVTVQYAYQKKPAVILDSSAEPEVPELCEAVCWDVLSMSGEYARDPLMIPRFERRAKEARWAAESTLQD